MATFVVKPDELHGLSRLPADHPKPVRLEWIDRGTDKRMRWIDIEMLLRTMATQSQAPGVAKLEGRAGLRLVFRSDSERDGFAAIFRRCLSEGRQA